MIHECPICGELALREYRGDYYFDPPPNIPGGVIVVRDTTWEMCSVCREVILSLDLGDRLERERIRREAGNISAGAHIAALKDRLPERRIPR